MTAPPRRPQFRFFVPHLLTVALCLPAPALGQGTVSAEQLAQMKAGVASALERARENPDSLLGWQMVLSSASMAAAVEANARGLAPDEVKAAGLAARDRVLEEWRRIRPSSGGPDLVLTWAIANPAEQEAAQLGLLDRYPDDPIVVERAGQILARRGETARWGALVDGLARGQPDNPEAFRLLAAYGARIENWSIAERAYERWGELRPADPQFLSSWLASPLARRDPGKAEAMLARFFAEEPASPAALPICSQFAVAGSLGSESTRAAARQCLARLSGSADPAVAEQAVARLAQATSENGDLTEALASIERLAPEARGRALLAVARSLADRGSCDEVAALVERAVVLPLPANTTGSLGPAARALRSCHERAPAGGAAAAYLRVLERAPLDELPGLVTAWSDRIDRGWGVELEGPLPAARVAALLERRLAKLPVSEAPHGLMFALYTAYRHGELLAARPDHGVSFFERWLEANPNDVSGEAAIAHAESLLAVGRRADAEAALERQLERGSDARIVDALAGLAAERGDAAALARLGATLEGQGSGHARGLALLLRARVARLQGDLPAAEQFYRQALSNDPVPPDAATELILLVASLRRPIAPLAVEICALRGVARFGATPEVCAARLLAAAGRAGGAVEVLARAADELPDDVSALRRLALEAHDARRDEAARRALRKALELDPRSPELWGELIHQESERFPLADVERSVEAARRALPELTWQIHTALAMAYRRANDPRRAVEVLMRSRPAANDDYTAAWTSQWLSEAYAELGALETALPAETLRPPAIQTPAVDAWSPARLLDLAEAWNEGSAEPLTPGGPRLDAREAWAIFERVATMDDPVARVLARGRLATLLELGRRGVPRDPSRARALWAEVGAILEGRAAAGGAGDSDARATAIVGLAKLGALTGPTDPARARELLEKAAEAPSWRGQSWVFHNLAWMREQGLGHGASDAAEALRGYRRAAEAGNAVSLGVLGRKLLDLEQAASCGEAVAALEAAARAGSSSASAELGNAWLWGHAPCVQGDVARALPHLETALRAGEPGADYNLGYVLLSRSDARAIEVLGRPESPSGPLPVQLLAFAHATGTGLVRDVAAARRWRAEASRRGSDLWSPISGALQAGSPALFKEGVERLQRLAERGDAQALATLAEWASTGTFVARDAQRAAGWALAAAEKGSPEGMRVLAGAYGEGHGVARDEAAALLWLRRGAAAGDPPCARLLGHALLRGDAGSPDRAEGLRWLERAAEAGDLPAVTDLARFHDEGMHGLEPDRGRAIHWYRRALEAGSLEARGWLAVNAANR